MTGMSKRRIRRERDLVLLSLGGGPSCSPRRMKKGFASFLFNRGNNGSANRGSGGGTSPRASAVASDSLQALERFMDSFGGSISTRVGEEGLASVQQHNHHARTGSSFSDVPVAVMHEGWTGSPLEGGGDQSDTATSTMTPRAYDEGGGGGGGGGGGDAVPLVLKGDNVSTSRRSPGKGGGRSRPRSSTTTSSSEGAGEGGRGADGQAPQQAEQGGEEGDEQEEEEEEEEVSVDVREGLIPTFQQVAFPMVLRLAEASLESLERLVAYVEERWKLEHRFARERMRTRLEFRQQSRMADDSLEKCMQALALYQDVESTQSYAVVEEMEQVVRAPLLKLREDLSRVVNDCRNEWRGCEKEVDALEKRVAKAKVVLKSKRERRVEVREKIEYYKRLAEEIRSAGSGGGVVVGGAGMMQQGGSGRGDTTWDIDRFLPPSGGGAGSTGFSLFDERPDRENLETTVLPRLHRQLMEVEGEIRSAAGGVELAVHQLLEGLGRLDHGHVRWTGVIQRAEEERRRVLQRVSSDYLMLQMRSSQLSFAQLDRLGRMMETVDNRQDLQRFVEVHSAVGVGGGAAGGTPMRSTALRLMPIGIDDLVPPQLTPYLLPTSPVKRDSSGGSISSSSHHQPQADGTTPPSSPEKSDRSMHSGGGSGSHHGGSYAVEEKLPFDEKEDAEVLSVLVKQMVLPPPPPPTEPPGKPDGQEQEQRRSLFSLSPVLVPPTSASTTTAPSPSHPPLIRKESFNWEGLAAAVGDKGSGALSSGGTIYSTDGERKRFFARIFSGQSCQGRSAFLQELNQYRSRKTDVGEGFKELCDVMWCLLTECQKNSDVHNAKMAMMLSQTFWHLGGGGGGKGAGAAPPPTSSSSSSPPPPPSSGGTGGGGGDELAGSTTANGGGDERSRREFLSNKLMGHPLWSDAAFWDQALWQCVLEQIPTIELSHGGPWHDLTGEARDDVVRRVQNIIFSQAGTLGYSMLEFGVGIPEAADFIIRVAERHQLSEEMKFTLLRHLFLHAQHIRPRTRSSSTSSSSSAMAR